MAGAALLEPGERGEAGKGEALCGGEEGLGGWSREKPALGPGAQAAIATRLTKEPQELIDSGQIQLEYLRQ